jgi:hypothetical protein
MFLWEHYCDLRRGGMLKVSAELPAAAATTTAAPTAISTASASGTSATISATATAATTTLDFGTRFVHVQGPATDLAVVESSDCLLSLFCVGHLDKTEAARASCITIVHNAYPIDLSVGFEDFP